MNNIDILSEDLAVSKSSSKDKNFDVIVGHIEDIVVSETFQEMQSKFMNKYCTEFEDSEENKLSYTPIFNEYVEMFEKFIGDELTKRQPGFHMKDFMKQLSKRSNEISEELFEMLSSFTEFLVFKELMVDHKAFTEGRCVDFSMDLTIRPIKNVDRDEK
ncbi:ADP-ribosylation factor-like protein 2-binding protein [Clytia hemisphaerica]|uniref:ADP-ribosylation factor-like protein 2-binding protein n=1 Tax=Clytia hemisphaerica TaxID=252671 RepID=A0A7M5VCF9_9CNID|eukprot:TCONS_00060745-protein